MEHFADQADIWYSDENAEPVARILIRYQKTFDAITFEWQEFLKYGELLYGGDSSESFPLFNQSHSLDIQITSTPGVIVEVQEGSINVAIVGVNSLPKKPAAQVETLGAYLMRLAYVEGYRYIQPFLVKIPQKVIQVPISVNAWRREG